MMPSGYKTCDTLPRCFLAEIVYSYSFNCDDVQGFVIYLSIHTFYLFVELQIYQLSQRLVL